MTVGSLAMECLGLGDLPRGTALPTGTVHPHQLWALWSQELWVTNEEARALLEGEWQLKSAVSEVVHYQQPDNA